MRSKQCTGSDSRLQDWQEHISHWEQSGKTQKEFCLERGLAIATFSYWRHKLRQSADDQSVKFYPLVKAPQPQENRVCSEISLFVVGSKYQLKLADNFSSDTLDKLLDILEAR